ncbi:L-serine ammonia-lyase [Bythopirellula polymerisocia]|uniref:L-serine dehydratase n=1 Tax=Bythopirellula polymerisocia TaxID=2528003 RepID=A0A5C6CAF3_9BACT|nr:L-serine ammonia-lyase [Bythopirellula polymerisocia]TWU20374.1 L-serine dehydratase TdcG [Bythopirellula polymerisocia]
MSISVLDLFTIGIGPSSSHCVGPMRAARYFATELRDNGGLATTVAIRVELYGSLALTGLGHGTNRAILLGLSGETPETVDPEAIESFVAKVDQTGELRVGGHQIDFSQAEHLHYLTSDQLPLHSNGMRFIASDASGSELLERVYYSVGGGFVVDGEGQPLMQIELRCPLAYPYCSATELLKYASLAGLRISEIARQNERSYRGEAGLDSRLDEIWNVMQRCVEKGCRQQEQQSSYLPGPLQVRRRAPQLYLKLQSAPVASNGDPLSPLDWVDVFALAVSEENACGGRVVTAPTNGAAGIIPAVLHYFYRFCQGANQEAVRRFLLTAGAIGILYKQNASISGAEVGCQGEVGAACSMAAGALAEVLGGCPAQVEQAAEIAMEHHLGLTCDPIGGLVQIPCIERNAMAASHAIHAARLALREDGQHRVSLDHVIEIMRQTGADMLSKYKETSQGGLAVNSIAC